MLRIRKGKSPPSMRKKAVEEKNKGKAPLSPLGDEGKSKTAKKKSMLPDGQRGICMPKSPKQVPKMTNDDVKDQIRPIFHDT